MTRLGQIEAIRLFNDGGNDVPTANVLGGPEQGVSCFASGRTGSYRPPGRGIGLPSTLLRHIKTTRKTTRQAARGESYVVPF